MLRHRRIQASGGGEGIEAGGLAQAGHAIVRGRAQYIGRRGTWNGVGLRRPHTNVAQSRHLLFVRGKTVPHRRNRCRCRRESPHHVAATTAGLTLPRDEARMHHRLRAEHVRLGAEREAASGAAGGEDQGLA